MALATAANFKELVRQTISVTALRVPSALTETFIKRLRGTVLERAKIRAVVPDSSDKTKRLVLLKESISAELPGVPSDTAEFIRQNAEVTSHSVELDYTHFSVDEILRRLLPSSVVVPSSFETVGHVVHLNLKDEQLPHRHLIGQVILEKHQPRIRTVVNKQGSIESQFRVFPMEVIAGDDDLNVRLRESGCVLEFNFAEVYWNSRLQTEHDRIVGLLGKTDVVCDMFAGIGPFAVPAAKQHRCRVYANDLNPRSYHYLVHNARLNKVEKQVSCYNLDAREFVRQLVDGRLTGRPEQLTHVIMNLPASAIEFLDAFVGLFPPGQRLPTIHCYAFAKENQQEKPERDLFRRIAAALGVDLDGRKDLGVSVFDVRNVAPNKNMYCVSFRLPPEIAYRAEGAPPTPSGGGSPPDPSSKRRKVEGDAEESATSS